MSYRTLMLFCSVAFSLAVGTSQTVGASAEGASLAAVDEGTESLSVGFGEGSAPAGSIVTVPVTFSAPDSARIGALAIRLKFLKTQLAFTKIDPSGLATAVDAKVEAQVKPGAAADTPVLDVTISTLAAGGSRQPIPVGPIAYVTFTIPDGAQAGTAIALESEATALTTDTPPKKIGPLATTKGTIEVAAPGIPPCLFYMH